MRYITVHKEKVSVHFLAYEDIKGKPKFTIIFNSIKSRYEEHQLPIGELLPHTSDTAATVMSELNG